MPNPNEYLVFEADQVLTNDHLNQLFYYVDQQNRWTRNKLAGIGIVCGLHLVQQSGVIQVTKGCGVTSQGYLILHDKTNYSYYIPYQGIKKPNDLPFTYPDPLPFYEGYCAKKSVYLLLSDDEYNNLEAGKQKQANTISSATTTFLDDFVVVLFLEATELDLKNCDAFDCNNKGEKIQFKVRPLLVKKTELPGVMPKDKAGKNTGNTVAPKQTAPEIDLKRFNVPYQDIGSSDDVLNAFLQIVDDNTLTTLANAYTFCYDKYKFLFSVTSNPFSTLAADLKKIRDNIIKSNPLFIQYFYDFIDDLIKAYYEFRVKARNIIANCCPDENLFPLHLVLGDATANTAGYDKDAFRQYFIYSPLFDLSGNETSEAVFLFTRMQILVKEFKALAAKANSEPDIKITPGQYQHYWLSQRAIPYYYKLNDPGFELYKYWSYSKTSHGNAAFNLSYNANLYNSSQGVTKPLLFDIEYYNFFRIEGHIGLNYKTCLSNILLQRKTYNLPFDVVAVSSELLRANSDKLPECNVNDLETDYKLMVREFVCKVHTPFCFITKFPFPIRQLSEKNLGLQQQKFSYSSFRMQADENVKMTSAIAFEAKLYEKGDFLREYCPPAANEKTAASAYLDALDDNGNFTNPTQLVEGTSGFEQQNQLKLLYYYVFEYVDSVETLMKVLTPRTIATVEMKAFLAAYRQFKRNAGFLTVLIGRWLQSAFPAGGNDQASEWLKEIELDIWIDEFSVAIYACIDERLETLKDEYIRRLQMYELQRSFLNYFRKHPGLEHKAGVPKGGTFVLVYNLGQQQEITTATGRTSDGGERSARDIEAAEKASKTTPGLAKKINMAYSYYDETTIKLFKSFLDECEDAPVEKKKEIMAVLTRYQPTGRGFEIADHVVIADFYVPYLCCSDCPPIAYVVGEPRTPMPEPEVTQFDIKPKVFLFDDANNYPFIAKPPVTDANVEQNPFNATGDLKNPSGLNLWTDEKNILYLHPAMPELKQTMKATLTYKDIAVEITIIRPDAAFQIQVSRSAQNTESAETVTLTAKNKDATSYEWSINGNTGILDKSATPGSIPLKQLIQKTDANEFEIQLTVTYELNEMISDNTKAGRITFDQIKKKIIDGDDKPFELRYDTDQ